MEENKLIKEKVFATVSYINLATMIGKCLQAAVYQLNHPDYKPQVFPKDMETAPLFDDQTGADDLSIEAQVDQAACLYDPRIRDIIGPSALYDMFGLASSLFSYDLQSPDGELSELDKRKAAFAWIITERTFAIYHPEEAKHFLILPDLIAGSIVYTSAPLALPLSTEDRKYISEACAACAPVVAENIPLRELVDNATRSLEKEKKAAQSLMLPPLGSIPNGESLNFLYRVASSKNSRLVSQSKNNRHEKVSVQRKGNALRFTRENEQSGTTSIVELTQADKYLGKSKTFEKTLCFALEKMVAQNYPLEVGFPLQELVDLGMYSTTSNAWRAIKTFFDQQAQTKLSGQLKKGKKIIKEKGGFLFYNYELDNGYVKLSVNENFNIDFLASTFTVFPRFAYALSNNAFSLVRYIFYLARQNASRIKEKGTFTIGLDSVRENLGLPAPEDVKNRLYRQLIIDPIEKAIDEIEEALKTVPEAEECSFTITPVGTDTSNINQWLAGYLEIGLKGDFAQSFIKFATKAEAERAKWNKVKTAELAKLVAKKELDSKKEDSE